MQNSNQQSRIEFPVRDGVLIGVQNAKPCEYVLVLPHGLERGSLNGCRFVPFQMLYAVLVLANRREGQPRRSMPICYGACCSIPPLDAFVRGAGLIREYGCGQLRLHSGPSVYCVLQQG